MMLAGLGGLAWVVAKVVFIFRCDSHVWNLSTAASARRCRTPKRLDAEGA